MDSRFFSNLETSQSKKNLKKIIHSKKLKKINFVTKGDDYQILFTASKKKSRIIKRTFKSLGIKISKIGNIAGCMVKDGILLNNTVVDLDKVETLDFVLSTFRSEFKNIYYFFDKELIEKTGANITSTDSVVDSRYMEACAFAYLAYANKGVIFR